MATIESRRKSVALALSKYFSLDPVSACYGFQFATHIFIEHFKTNAEKFHGVGVALHLPVSKILSYY